MQSLRWIPLGKLLPFILVLFVVSALFAQQNTFTERGVVKAQGRPVPGATVTAALGEDKVSTSTGDDGTYELTLPAGEWKVTVEMFGFAPSTQTLHPGPSAPPMEWTLQLRQGGFGGRGGRPGLEPAKPAPEIQEDPSVPDSLTGVPNLAPPGSDPSHAAGSDSFLIAGSTAQGLPGLLQEGLPGGFGPGFGPFGGAPGGMGPGGMAGPGGEGG